MRNNRNAWTTLDSILKRGIANSNIINVMKITKELNIDTESLASGIIIDSYKSNISEINKEVPEIMRYYKKLNDIGKHEATKRVMELSLLPQYSIINRISKDEDMEIASEIPNHFTDVESAIAYLSESTFVAFGGSESKIPDSDLILLANIAYKNKHLE